MAYQAPGKHHREGITLPELLRWSPDDATAERWFAQQRWLGEEHCPHCGSLNVQTGAKHKTMPCRCRDCRKRFIVSALAPRWRAAILAARLGALAIYLLLGAVGKTAVVGAKARGKRVVAMPVKGATVHTDTAAAYRRLSTIFNCCERKTDRHGARLVAKGMVGKLLWYVDLIAPTGESATPVAVQ